MKTKTKIIVEKMEKVRDEYYSLPDFNSKKAEKLMRKYECLLEELNRVCAHTFVLDYAIETDDLGRSTMVDTDYNCIHCGIRYEHLDPLTPLEDIG